MTTVIYSALTFVALLAVLRIMGKRAISDLSAVDLVVLFVIGDITADAIVSEDTSFTGSLVAMSTFGLLTITLSWVAYHFPRTRPLIEGVPTIIVRDGVPDTTAMRRERVSADDLNEAARAEGICDLADVELAILESDGRFTFFNQQ